MKKLIFSFFAICLFANTGFAQLKVEAAGVKVGAETTPVEALDVNGALKLGTTANSNAGTLRWTGTDFEGYDGSNWLKFAGAGASMWSNNGGKAYYNGNVGIGNDNPAAKFSVNSPQTSSSASTGVNMFEVTDGTDGSFYIGEGSSGTGRFNPVFAFAGTGIDGTSGKLTAVVETSRDVKIDGRAAFIMQAQEDDRTEVENADILIVRNFGTPLMTVDRDGNVGIGYTTPSHKLHVNGDVVANNIAAPSDARLKKNISNFDNGLESVMRLQPVSFQYNGKGNIDDTESTHIGVIAQDFQKVAPFAVRKIKLEENTKIIGEQITSRLKNEGEQRYSTKQEYNEYLSVNTNSIIFMLINSVKEQQIMINELKNELSELKKEKKDSPIIKKQ